MLIIFDLDDTLIDTSGCIIPIQLKNCIDRLQNAGDFFSDKELAYQTLLRINKSASSATSALKEFFEICEIPSSFFELANHAVYEDFSENFFVEPQDMALQTLQRLKESHKLALVTVGKEDIQYLKLKKAGIDSEFFSKIVVTQQKNKKVHYQSIINELDVDPSDVVVCGDRIVVDLTPAKELGLKTVQMLAGRGVYCKGNKNDVDFTISHLTEIIRILPQFSNIISLKGNGSHDDK